MPRKVDKAEALARLEAERASSAEPCLMCAVRSGQIAGGPELFWQGGARAFLTRYPIRWGHVLVVPDVHVERFCDLSTALWSQCNTLALRAARMLERSFEPARVYVASLGAAEPLLPTCPHLHLHVVPVAHSSERPSQVLTWENGVFEASDAEWNALQTLLLRADDGAP